MSDEYTPFSADLDGDGVEDQAAIYTLEDGGNVIVGDLDGNGEADFAAVDEDGNGVYEQSYNALTGEYTDLTADPAAETGTTDTADYDGSGGNLDGDIAQYDTESTDAGTDTASTDTASTDTASTETAGTGASTGGYYDAAAVSDMMAMQHETSMAIINNI